MKYQLQWHVKKFEELSLDELYQIMKLRSEVFVVEQDCVYLDLDDKDGKALHIFGVGGGKIRAYARLFNKGTYFDQASLGRVVVPYEDRNYGYGHELIEECIKAIRSNYGTTEIKISAQTYLRKFYESHRFQKVGEEYLEDGIPHIAMIKE
ncbi:GNAT family N-acetyltransferase [Sungkyunkwania multivorans]|uniref:GNAT family N-acetyltransferase n=1 Tax=Sungkyunkwania multivorans TaxID=1173618 RepID=A0ABW3CZD3_9FLAO